MYVTTSFTDIIDINTDTDIILVGIILFANFQYTNISTVTTDTDTNINIGVSLVASSASIELSLCVLWHNPML